MCRSTVIICYWEASDRWEINISKARLMGDMSNFSQQTKKRVYTYLFWKKTEALVLTNTLIRFSKDWIKRLTPSTEVARRICRHGKGCHVHLGKGEEPGYSSITKKLIFTKTWTKYSFSFSLSCLFQKGKDLSLVYWHPNGLWFQVVGLNSAHLGPRDKWIRLSIWFDACRWIEAFKMVSQAL